MLVSFFCFFCPVYAYEAGDPEGWKLIRPTQLDLSAHPLAGLAGQLGLFGVNLAGLVGQLSFIRGPLGSTQPQLGSI